MILVMIKKIVNFSLNCLLMFHDFLNNYFGGHQSFLWGHWYPVLDFWWRLPLDSKPGGFPCLHALSPVRNRFLWITTGVIPADLLVPSMVAESFGSTCLYALPLAHRRLVRFLVRPLLTSWRPAWQLRRFIHILVPTYNKKVKTLFNNKTCEYSTK